ncbi:MAG TPA: PepSY-like domain-containing protein [Puia sp.]|nr:PepSY-like domain-containing protein [Puia sp.]
MKKNLKMTLLFCGLASFAFAQREYNPPTAVREAFQKEYPKSTPSHWTRSSAGWSVEFDDKDFDNGESTARFDSRGRHLETQIPYDEGDVPKEVKDHMKQHYPDADNYEYTRIDRPGEKPLYKAKFRHKKAYSTTYVDDRGEQRDYH